MATRSSILAWKIPWMEDPCRLQSMGLQSHMRLSTTMTFLKCVMTNIFQFTCHYKRGGVCLLMNSLLLTNIKNYLHSSILLFFNFKENTC